MGCLFVRARPGQEWHRESGTDNGNDERGIDVSSMRLTGVPPVILECGDEGRATSLRGQHLARCAVSCSAHS